MNQSTVTATLTTQRVVMTVAKPTKKKESKGKKGHTRRGAGQHKSGGVGGTRKGKGAHGAVDEKCCVVDPDQDLSGFGQIASRTVPIQRNRRLTPFNLALSQVIVN